MQTSHPAQEHAEVHLDPPSPELLKTACPKEAYETALNSNPVCHLLALCLYSHMCLLTAQVYATIILQPSVSLQDIRFHAGDGHGTVWAAWRQVQDACIRKRHRHLKRETEWVTEER